MSAHLLEQWRLASTFKDRLGSCYQLAGQAVVDDKGDLIHGSIQGEDNPRIGHAWVDTGEGIYAPVIDKDLPYDFWIRFAKPIEEVRYTKTEAMIQMLRSKHWGPW